MTRAAKPTANTKGIRAEMVRNAMAHNKFLTKEYLQFKTNEMLLCFVHPSDRLDFALKLGIKVTKVFVDPEFD